VPGHAVDLVEEHRLYPEAIRILLEDNHGHFDTGFIGTPLVLDVLQERGRADVAFTLMNQTTFPSFGYAIRQGATTLWEAWDGRGSHCHPMFGGVCRWFFQGLGGINPDAARPGFDHIILKPTPAGDLTWCEARYRSIRGQIALRWERAGGKMRVHVLIPANADATLVLPDGDRALGSGDYDFTVSAAG
jgi:alpha-L-rhamnosidase